MSALNSKIFCLEAQLGEIHQRISEQVRSSFHRHVVQEPYPTESLSILENNIDSLSVKSRNQPVPNSERLVELISRSREDLRKLEVPLPSPDIRVDSLHDLSWLLVAKASIQTQTILMRVLSENVLLLNDEITYWDSVLASKWYIGLYTLQTSPFRLWRGFIKPYNFDTKFSDDRNGPDNIKIPAASASSKWMQFFVDTPLVYSFRSGIFSPMISSKLEIQQKMRRLIAARDFNASSLGLLLEEGLSFDNIGQGRHEFSNANLQEAVSEGVSLMNSLLHHGNEKLIPQFSQLTAATIRGGGHEPKHSEFHNFQETQAVIEQLIYILRDFLPKYSSLSVETRDKFGRPPAIIRYWLPLSFALVSASTSLTLLRNLRPAIIRWIGNFGSTTLEFLSNWVVEPTWRLIRTIRHDENSEIALMSKNSLEADRESLERMVVDFVLDRGEQNYPTLSADAITTKVREGDLTPVLRAYEKDLRSPFVGTVRGDLVRALLIQIQKTKVDVEIAMSGIDALLKSQELVFGFVGLTPGLLISYASIRWLYGLLGNRRGFRMVRRQDDLRYALRNIHRLLTSSNSAVDDSQKYKNHGLLICNAEILLRRAEIALSGEHLKAFQEDISDLINENSAHEQLKITERMAWTYSKWI